MDAPDGLPVPRRWWSTLAISLGTTMAVLDTTIVNVALPTIAGDLGASEADSIWVINAFQIVLTVSILPLASLADRVGHRRFYRVGLIVFVLASLACALAQSIPVLVLARIVQGCGAACVMSVNGALIRFTNPRDRLGVAIGIGAMVVATASALGPTIASAILAVGSWRWLFGVNVPLGVVTLAIAWFALPRGLRSPHRFDALSALMSAAAFGLAIYGVESLSRAPSVWSWLEIAAGLALGWALVRREQDAPAPLVPVDLYRSGAFALASATGVSSFVAQGLALVSLPFMIQASLGRSAVETGLLMTPWPLALGLMAPLAGRLADRYPVGLLGGIGLGVFAFGLALLAGLPAHASDFDLIWRMAVCGAGFGLFQSPNNRAMMTSVPVQRAGAAGGAVSTGRLVGQTLGALGVAVLFRLDPQGATRLALGCAAGVAAAAAIISSLRLVRRP